MRATEASAAEPRGEEIFAHDRLGAGAYLSFAREVLEMKSRLRELLGNLKKEGARIAAYEQQRAYRERGGRFISRSRTPGSSDVGRR